MTSPERDPGAQQHGNVFGRGWGSMFIHVQRETGLAHRTMVLRPWQVQALRLVASKWFAAVLTVTVLSWMYFAFQSARVPFLTRRITHLEQDSAMIDTLQATLDQLQRRYTQVQQMLSASARSTPPASSKAEAPKTPPTTVPPATATPTSSPTAKATEPPKKAPASAPAKAPVKPPTKAPALAP